MNTSVQGVSETRFPVVGGAFGLAAGLLGFVGQISFGIAGGLVGAFVAAGLGALVLGRFAGRTGPRAPAQPETAAIPATPEAKLPEPLPPEPEKPIPSDRIDILTELPNANGLAAWFVEKGARLAENGKSIVVLVAGLDRFDEVERIRGKDTADQVLIEVARRVGAFVGEEGIAARTGGDEFVAVAAVSHGSEADEAEERAGKLAETISRPIELRLGTMWIGGSVGGAFGSPRAGEATLARARTAFAEARRLGLGRFWVDLGTNAKSA